MTAERYTAVFTGAFPGKEPGEYLYMTLGDGTEELCRGRPPGERLKREVAFSELPEEGRRAVLAAYRRLWGLEDAG